MWCSPCLLDTLKKITCCNDYVGSLLLANLIFAAADATVKGRFFKTDEQVKDYWLDDVNCVGNEQCLLECKHRGIDKENCRQGERAGVHCLSKYIPLLSPSLVNIMK